MNMRLYHKYLLGKHPMTIAEALRIVSPYRASYSLIYQLSMNHAHNDAHDERLLVAAIIVKKMRHQNNAHC